MGLPLPLFERVERRPSGACGRRNAGPSAVSVAVAGFLTTTLIGYQKSKDAIETAYSAQHLRAEPWRLTDTTCGSSTPSIGSSIRFPQSRAEKSPISPLRRPMCTGPQYELPATRFAETSDGSAR